MHWPWKKEHSTYEEVSPGDAPVTSDTIPQGAVRRRILFTGTVQGVGFRFTSKSMAENHHLTGWVKNLDDGDVLVEAQGRAEDIASFCEEVVNPSYRVWFHAHVKAQEGCAAVPEHSFRVIG